MSQEADHLETMEGNREEMNTDGSSSMEVEHEAWSQAKTSMEMQESERKCEDGEDVVSQSTHDQVCVTDSGDTVQDMAEMDGLDNNMAVSAETAGDVPSHPQDVEEVQFPDQFGEVKEQETANELMDIDKPDYEQDDWSHEGNRELTGAGNDLSEARVMGESTEAESKDNEQAVAELTISQNVEAELGDGETSEAELRDDENPEAELGENENVEADIGENEMAAAELIEKEKTEADEEAVAKVIETSHDDSAFDESYTAGGDFSMSAEEEDKLLAENEQPMTSMQDDGNTPAVDQVSDASAAVAKDLKSERKVESDMEVEPVDTEGNEDGFAGGTAVTAVSCAPGPPGNSPDPEIANIGDSSSETKENLGKQDNVIEIDVNAAIDTAGPLENTSESETICVADSSAEIEENLEKEKQDVCTLEDEGKEADSEIIQGSSSDDLPVGGCDDTDQEAGQSVHEEIDQTAKTPANTEDEPTLQVTEVKSIADIENFSADSNTAGNGEVTVEPGKTTGVDNASDLDSITNRDAAVTSEKKEVYEGTGSASGIEDTAATSRETKPPSVKTAPVDDDDDVVVLDDEEVGPPAVKRESTGKEVFTNNSDMGIQIASVSGGADELHKMAEQNQVKQENSDIQKSVLANALLKTATMPGTQILPPGGTPPAKKTPAKTQTCIVCKRVGKCKYNIVRNGDIKHLCDNTCFKRFRTNPSMYLRGTVAKLTDSPAWQQKGQTSGVIAPATAGVAKPSTPAVKTCVVCQIMSINKQGQFCMWKGMDFCGEGCLGKFQSGISTNCALCKTFIPLTARSSNCLRLGNQIKPFCSSRCYQDYKQHIRLCTYCQSDLSKVTESFSSPVGADGTFKDFCSQSCLRQFENLVTSDVEIIKVEQGKQKNAGKCSVCQKVEKTKHAIKFSGATHNLCSDPCLSAFRYANKLDINTCDFCSTICSSLESSPHTVFFEGNKKRFCSDACVSKYRFTHRRVVSCSWCGSKRENFDMIERLDSSSKYQLFCSLNCLSLFRVNLQAKSNQAVTCDHCHKYTPAQYHLTMSDASVRNFCSYNCVMSFQSQFSKGQPPLPPALPTPTTLAATHKHNTRGKASNRSMHQPTATSAVSVPIISNVISLAPQGSQTVNIKNSTGVPLVVSGTSPGGKTPTTTTGSSPGSGSVQQKIIIQPPQPKAVKNKALMCKPFTQTKATSCRPHAQSKECQTEEVKQKPALVPVPVPVYLPAPMALYSSPAPTPVFMPIPIPIPIFIPTTRKSASGIMKQIEEQEVFILWGAILPQEILDKTPSDPLEAELLQMAAAVSEEGTMESDSDTEEETLSEVRKSQKRPAPEDNDDDGDADTMRLTQGKDGEEDMISMALRMAEEITDLESAVEAVPVNTETLTPAVEDNRVLTEEIQPDDSRLRRSTRKNVRGAGRPKRPRIQESALKEQDVEPQPAAPPPDLNYHLKFMYGVNAWRHWVMMKNACIEQNAKAGSGRVKLFKTDLLQCTADELNYSLCLFVKEVRKPNGEEYSPDSIYYLTLGLQQHLFENGRIDNIFADHYYEPFTKRLSEILSTCQPKFNAAGQMVCRIEEEHLWECKQLGAHSPYVLLNTLIYFHTKFFMLKTPEDHMKLSFAHILKYWKKGAQLVKGGQVQRCVSLRYYSVSSARKDASATVSTTKRGSRDGIPVFEVIENQGNPLRCPVKLYEFFLSKCPESIKNRSDIFYPVPERSCVPDSPVWYSTMPIQEDVMARMLTRILLVREIQEAHLHAQPIYV